jgi:hypothetical protein
MGWCCSVNCEAELLYVLLDRRDPKSVAAGALVRDQKRIPSKARPGNCSRGAREAKMVFHIIVRRLIQALLRLCSGLLRLCSGLLRLCSGYSPSAQVSSPSAQVKAAVAHVRRLKRNQRKGKLILSMGVFCLLPLEIGLTQDLSSISSDMKSVISISADPSGQAII